MSLLQMFMKQQLDRFHAKLALKINFLALRKRKKSYEERNSVALPTDLWRRILGYVPAQELLKLRRVSKDFEAIVTEIFSTILYLDVFKIECDDLINTHCLEDTFTVCPKARFVLRIKEHRVTILIRKQCTARDITRIFGSIRYFAKFVRTATVDASVFELIVAGLSSMDLTRWHAFQCYLKAFNGNTLEDAVHVHCVKSVTDVLLMPNLTELTICVSPDEFSCLSRLIDYGVSSSSIYSISNLNLLRLSLPADQLAATCCEEIYYRRRCSQHIKAFKNWSSALSLCEKYCQKYS